MLLSAALRAASRRSLFNNCLTGLFLSTALGSAAQAQDANVYQMYYVPMPEADVTSDNDILYTSTGNTMRSLLSISSVLNGSIVYFDHNADGYEADVTNPVQPTSQVWGDADDSNGIAPGFGSDPDGLPGGTVIILDQTYNVTTAEVCANAGDPCRLNGGDRFGSNKALAVTRAAWNTTPGSVLAGAVEVASSNDWGAFYTVPIGGNAVTPADSGNGVSARQLFEMANAYVQARAPATVTLTRAADSSTEQAILAAGETAVFDDVRPGDTIDAGAEFVQVNLLTGNIGVNYESRWYRLPPDSQWASDYYSPVGTTVSGDASYYYLFNPGASAITVSVTGNSGALASISVPAGAAAEYRGVTSGTAVRFLHDVASPEPFYVLAAVDAGAGSNTLTHDWGFSLVPAAGLTGQSLVGLAPSSEDGSDAGSVPDDANASPVWVTAVEDTHLCVDYDGDGTIDSDFDIDALDMTILLDSADNDMTGAFMYTINDVNGDNADTCISEGGDDTQTDIAVAWGQDPANAPSGSPAIDVGTTVLAVPEYAVSKRSELRIDADSSGNISPGDTLAFIIEVDNYGALPLNNAILTDVLQPILTFDPVNSTVDGGTTWDCTPQPDGTTQCLFGSFTVAPLTSKQIEIAATLPADAAGAIVINNSVSLVPGDDVATSGDSETPVNNAAIGDTAWVDLDNNGAIDAGEPRLAGVIIELRNGICTPFSNCPTATTDTNGAYLFETLPAGSFEVAIISSLPAGGASGYDSDGGTDGISSVTLAAGETTDVVDFAILLSSGVISGQAFEDLNNDGLPDTGDTGLGGVVVELVSASCTAGVDCPTTVTADDGSYGFIDQAPGSYVVALVNPDGYSLATTGVGPVTLPVAGNAVADFGFVAGNIGDMNTVAVPLGGWWFRILLSLLVLAFAAIARRRMA